MTYCDNTSRELIEQRAYILWEQAGRPEGRGEEFWLLAQDQIREEQAGHPAHVTPPALDPSIEQTSQINNPADHISRDASLHRNRADLVADRAEAVDLRATIRR